MSSLFSPPDPLPPSYSICTQSSVSSSLCRQCPCIPKGQGDADATQRGVPFECACETQGHCDLQQQIVAFWRPGDMGQYTMGFYCPREDDPLHSAHTGPVKGQAVIRSPLVKSTSWVPALQISNAMPWMQNLRATSCREFVEGGWGGKKRKEKERKRTFCGVNNRMRHSPRTCFGIVYCVLAFSTNSRRGGL